MAVVAGILHGQAKDQRPGGQGRELARQRLVQRVDAGQRPAEVPASPRPHGEGVVVHVVEGPVVHAVTRLAVAVAVRIRSRLIDACQRPTGDDGGVHLLHVSEVANDPSQGQGRGEQRLAIEIVHGKTGALQRQGRSLELEPRFQKAALGAGVGLLGSGHVGLRHRCSMPLGSQRRCGEATA